MIPIISVVGKSGVGKTTFLLTDVDIILTEGYKRGDAPKGGIIDLLEERFLARGGGL